MRFPTLALCSALLLPGVAPPVVQGPRPKPVTYEQFGAKGDGKADDMPAIVKAHLYANQHGRPVRAADKATYRIGGAALTAVIGTDTDFGSARFLIDDRAVENRGRHLFSVESRLRRFKVKGVTSLKRGQSRIGVSLPHPCVVIATDKGVRHYIRYGLNRNKGKPQRDVFLVGRKGKVDPKTPILWDFRRLSSLEARPVDRDTLTVRGGRFTTIANAADSRYTYYSRGLTVRRSNVVIEGLEHRITGEGKQGAPYGGFLNISTCANVTVRDCLLSGHKTYRTVGSAGLPVSMGSYDILVNTALNVLFVNCRQANDIHDRSRWGIMASNYCKNLRYEGCTLSRFDAHMGVANATIRNSVIGHAGINAIGFGTLLLEGTTVISSRLVALRGDYGSTWQGEFIIRNCTFKPILGRRRSLSLITGHNSGRHDFGYPCHMPERITIEKLRIEDGKASKGYRGPALFSNFNGALRDATYREKYPYRRTKRVILKGVATASGKPLRLSDNRYMFKDVKVVGSSL